MNQYLVLTNALLDLKSDSAMRILETHAAYIKEHLAQGHILFVGMRTNFAGAILVWRAPSEETLCQWLDNDPFCLEKIESHEVIEFMKLDSVESLNGTWFE